MGDPRRRIIGKWFFILVGLGTAAFLAAGAAMSLAALGNIREVVSRQFNEEQLIIARNVQRHLERELAVIRKEISAAKSELKAGSHRADEPYAPLRSSLNRLAESGIQRIEVYDFSENTVTSYADYGQTLQSREMEGTCCEFGSPSAVREYGTWVSEIRIKPGGLMVALATVLGDSGDRILCYWLNTSWLLKPYLSPIRSGKTGYPWIIDQNGLFLYHQDSGFVGQNAFTARAGKDPLLPFDDINRIMRDKMMRGEEGSGYYTSGWHRGLTGPVKKLAAFAPIHISDSPSRIWSVAVTAPIFEIEGQIRRAYIWQFVIQGLIFGVVVLASLTMIFFERRWSRVLADRVASRTSALKRSEERYRLLLESAEDYIFSLSEDYRLTTMNHYTARFFGGAPEDFIGKDFTSLFPSRQAEKQIRRIRQVFHFGQSVRDEIEWRIGGCEVWVDASFLPLKDTEGKTTSVLCIARDVTENKRLERNLINTEKLASLGTLAAGVAHEINNPLGVILGFCDILLRKAEPGSQTQEDLKIIERQGLHCKEIVENLLSFARTEDLVHGCSDLNQSLRDIVRVVRHSLEMKGVALEESFAENLPLVVGDSRKLQQVFLNMINNAAAAMDAGGVLRIRTLLERHGNRAVVEFQDDGQGIREEDLKHIFEPFFTTKPAGQGTGLGLFVSYGIVTGYGGTVQCESRTAESPEGPRGTTFTVKLKTYSQEGSWSTES